MQLSTYVMQITGKAWDELFSLRDPLVQIEQDITGKLSIPFWHESLPVAKPTDEEIAAALAAPEPETAPDILSISDRQFRMWVLAALKVEEAVFIEEARKL